MATKKGSTKKSSAKKSSGKKGAAKKSAKKAAGKKAAAKKGAAKKGGAKIQPLADVAEVICTLDPNNTVDLVLDCAPQASDISVKLKNAGFITAGQRTAFRDCIFQAVLGAGCLISRENIPAGPETRLRDVVFFILDSI